MPITSTLLDLTRCAMCGYEYDASLLTCHAGCPLAPHCTVICCPRCGYSTVDPARSDYTQRFIRLFRRKSVAPGVPGALAETPTGTGTGSAIRLLDLKPGQSGHVVDVGGDTDILLQLSQYGLLPGTPVRLARKYPVPIVQVGQTDLALDRSVAARIFVDL